jgi:hypothetical protein
MEDALRVLLAEQQSVMADRFMYGTDWHVTLSERNVSSYLDEFVRTFVELESKPGVVPGSFSNRFFGSNAGRFLGLQRNGKNRARLEAFYARMNVSAPGWIAKVDALT